MNNQPSQPVAQDLIDLFAEGELESDAHQELFRNLDQDPTGWKRCALALMETQALKRSIRQIDFPGSAEKTSPPLKPISLRPERKQRLLKTAKWATAATLFITIGLMAGRYWPNTSQNLVDSRVQTNAGYQHPLAQELAQKDRALRLQFEKATQAIGISDGRLIAFLGTYHDEKSQVFPIIESEQLAQQLAGVSEPKLPKTVEQELARKGWKVDSQKQFVSIPQRNGDRKTIPIGMLNYQFVGRETF